MNLGAVTRGLRTFTGGAYETVPRVEDAPRDTLLRPSSEKKQAPLLPAPVTAPQATTGGMSRRQKLTLATLTAVGAGACIGLMAGDLCTVPGYRAAAELIGKPMAHLVRRTTDPASDRAAYIAMFEQFGATTNSPMPDRPWNAYIPLSPNACGDDYNAKVGGCTLSQAMKVDTYQENRAILYSYNDFIASDFTIQYKCDNTGTLEPYSALIPGVPPTNSEPVPKVYEAWLPVPKLTTNCPSWHYALYAGYAEQGTGGEWLINGVNTNWIYWAPEKNGVVPAAMISVGSTDGIGNLILGVFFEPLNIDN